MVVLETAPSVCEEKILDSGTELELRVRQRLAAGDLHAAATHVIQGYGPEVMGFLVAHLGSEDDAREAMAQASFDLWSSIGTFDRRASLRTWFYTLAKHAAARLRRAAYCRPGRQLSLDDVDEPRASGARSETAPYLRTDARCALAAIREALSPDDRALLILRIDRRMSWREVAGIMLPEGDTPGTVNRLAARLRKRFQALKAEIREQARAAGVMPDEV